MKPTFLAIVAAAALAVSPAATLHATPGADAAGKSTLDNELRARARAALGSSRVILRLDPGVPSSSAEAAIRHARGIVGRRLASVGGQVAYVPDAELEALGRTPGISAVSLDRRVQGSMERTGATIGATWVRDNLGLDGTGVGVAIVDSGVAAWHDDLGSSRVAKFVDFVNFQPTAYDDYGHGTHVAGIVAGDGHDSEGHRRGVAPGAALIVEKVLDGSGQGYISNVIAAIDYAIANRTALNIRVLNLSVAAGVYESYNSDPLTLAAKHAVDAGIVVVSAAGNLGKNADGQPQYGGIGAPGNAPWVITVGASSHNGTVDRSDDTIAGFSSRGPSAIDFQAKPDLVAPGVGIESIAEAGSTLWNTKPLMRLWGTVPTATEPYLALSGTSMAAPVVSGTIALMLQANPSLTPNLVKAILQYTAETHTNYNDLTQGAGFLNARGAVEAARASATGTALVARADPTPWSGQVIWGNHRLSGDAVGAIAAAGAWSAGVTWGAAGVLASAAGGPDENIVWGTECGGADCDDAARTSSRSESASITWSTNAMDDAEADNRVWGPPAVIRRQWRIPVLIDPVLQ